ncbi:concanavalin A-like lectin/glucanase domain-containing protein [Lentinula edodes]|nr:concanavalin A-like lectin/glucanase domain-containing protein [Lentinula edodes]
MFFFCHSLLCVCLFFSFFNPISASNIASRLARRTSSHVQRFTKDLNVALDVVLASREKLQPQVHLTTGSQTVFCKSDSGATSAGGNSSSSSSSPSSSSGSSGSSKSAGSSTNTASAAGSSSTGVAVSSPYKLVEEHSGSDFFNGWTFTDAADVTTHGLVNYVDQGTASANNLTEITSDGTVIMRVETTATVTGNRQSIRITTNNVYNSGLWILDAIHMPTGCGTWPAFWTNGPNWPDGGEIDIVEGVGDNTNDQATLHTLEGCSLASSSSSALDITGSVITSTDCVSTGGGCGIRSSSTVSYGAAFNGNGGGVFTMTLNSSGIAVWFFERSAIPSDITAGTPLPALWGTPFAWWSSPSCNITEFFGYQSTIFDTTLCGDLAGSVWADAGAPGQEQSCATRTGVSDCNTFVQNNGAAFQDAYWELNSVKIYQIPG